jgi:multicomponent Na+:H+ antiporter subunit D
MNYLPLFAAIPLGGAFLIAILGRQLKRVGETVSVAAAVSLFLLALLAAFALPETGILVGRVGGWGPPLSIGLVLDHLSALILLTVNLMASLCSVYAVRYVDRFTDRWKFYALFLLMIAGLNGVVITADIFNLFVFLEIASIASYALVAFGTEAEELEASLKYLVMGGLASCLILLGIALLYGQASTLSLAHLASSLEMTPLLFFSLALFTAGFGIKAAVVPFHSWLPDAHPAAPAPVSALLSGVLIKSLGIYSFARILFNVFGNPAPFPDLMLYAGLLSMTVGAFLAIGQDDIKRMFAYSSISQVGYIVFALGIGTPLALMAGLFHLVNHAAAKSLLFLDAGAIEASAGTRDLKKLGGLFPRMPLTGTTSLIAAFSISGIPPTAGFFSKLLLILAAVDAGHVVGALLAAAVSVVTLAYYLKFLRGTFFRERPPALDGAKDPPPSMAIPMVILAAICLLGGLLLLCPGDYFGRAAAVLTAGRAYGDRVLSMFGQGGY